MSTPPGGTTQPTLRIALIDDDRSLLGVVQAIADEAFAGSLALVRQWTTAHEAARDLAILPPDLIILDLGLPDFDGITVLRRLRADRRFREIPILMLTANSDWSALQLALDAGADAYLFKPFDGATLAESLRDLMRLRLARDPSPPELPPGE